MVDKPLIECGAGDKVNKQAEPMIYMEKCEKNVGKNQENVCGYRGYLLVFLLSATRFIAPAL
jgi:hypothetical protein